MQLEGNNSYHFFSEYVLFLLPPFATRTSSSISSYISSLTLVDLTPSSSQSSLLLAEPYSRINSIIIDFCSASLISFIVGVLSSVFIVGALSSAFIVDFPMLLTGNTKLILSGSNASVKTGVFHFCFSQTS